MAGWEINKGIGRSVEFKGLKAQYLFIFAGGLLAVFLVTVILYLCNVDQVLCLVMGVLGATVVVWQTFSMNSKEVLSVAIPDTLLTVRRCFIYS